MSSREYNIRRRRLSVVKSAGIVAILAVAVSLWSNSTALAQAPVNLSGTWVGNGGSQTTFTHSGNSLSGKAWGGPNNRTLTGSMTLTGGQSRPVIYRGTYKNQQGKLRGWGTITITVYHQNKIFVSYKGIVTDGRQSSPVQDSGFAYRK